MSIPHDVYSFSILYGDLIDELKSKFLTGRSHGRTPNGSIQTKLKLSAAIHYFPGSSSLDVMPAHGMTHASVYNSAWGVVDAVNKTSSLIFNANSAQFPSHDEQDEITK